MGETFYTILGVAPDADREAIRGAYRDQVKDVHPDVNDDPAAVETFKQLTTTRDVLLDREERRRYDRLGHDECVREHVNSSVWTPSESASSAGERRGDIDAGPRDSGATAGGNGPVDRVGTTAGDRTWDSRQQAGGRRGAGRNAWTGTPPHYGTDSTREHGRRARNRRKTGTFVQDSWQTASEAYRRTETGFDTDTERTLSDVAVAVRRLAPWLLIHAVLITSMLATVWFAYTSTAPRGGAAVSTFLGALALVGVVVALSVFHVLSVLYT